MNEEEMRFTKKVVEELVSRNALNEASSLSFSEIQGFVLPDSFFDSDSLSDLLNNSPFFVRSEKGGHLGQVGNFFNYHVDVNKFNSIGDCPYKDVVKPCEKRYRGASGKWRCGNDGDCPWGLENELINDREDQQES